MPDPVDADSIAAAAAGPASASVDGQSATAHSIESQITADQYKKAAEAAEGGNPRGGPRSGWNMTRPAKAVPPGAV